VAFHIMHAAAASSRKSWKSKAKAEAAEAEDEARATFTFIRFVFVSCFDLPASSRSLPQEVVGGGRSRGRGVVGGR